VIHYMTSISHNKRLLPIGQIADLSWSWKKKILFYYEF
jgi:hypothetical protein